MATVAIHFTDVERDGEKLIDMDIQPIDGMTPDSLVTPALHTAGLVAYMLNKGYHHQYNEEYIKEAQRVGKQQELEESQDSEEE